MTLKLAVLYAALVVSFASSAFANVTYTKSEDGGQTVIRMSVTPAAEPIPGLRHRLMARDVDLKPGNAAPYYYRAMLDLPSTMERIRKEFGDDYDNWYIPDGTPIDKLPLDRVRKADSKANAVIHNYLADAMQRRDCDWELNIEQLRGPSVVEFRLPEFQNSREFGRLLALRARLAVAEHRYDDAIENVRMSFRLGHDVTRRVPFIVCGLIGIAIDGIATGPLTDLIAAPDSPNMYWALTELREPVIDLQPALKFEMDFGPRIFPFMHNAETTEHTPQEWNRLLTLACRDFQAAGGPSWLGMPVDKQDFAAGIAATGLALCTYSHAKEQLIAQHMDVAQVEKMAVGQVIAIYTERTYQRFVDDAIKLTYYPFPEADKAAEALDKRIAAATPLGTSDEREAFPMTSLLLPGVQRARTAQIRLDRNISSLRVIEALRMYAAGHDGRLPDRLEEIHEVPIPINPATGKAFLYRVEGTTAILELPPTDRIPGGNCRYEIQIAVKK